MKKIILFVGLILLILSGCQVKKVMIQSNPQGAMAYVNNAEMGKTPFKQNLKFSKGETEHNYRLSLVGYEDTVLAISYKPKEVTNYTVKLEKKQVVFLKLISYEPIQTDEGIRLSRVVRLSRAFLEQIERSPNVQSVTRITNMIDSTSQIGYITITPDDEYLAYSVYSVENGKYLSNIWKQKIGGSAKSRITFGTKLDLFPFFSRSNDYLYFSSNRNSPNSQIWRIGITGGGGLTKITSSLNEDYHASSDQSGKVIAYSSKPMDIGDPQIWTINNNGNLPTQLREGESPSISPDGTKILFTRPDQNNLATVGKTSFYPQQLWTMTVGGSNETLLTQNLIYNCIHPSWSPDGKWIVFVSDEGTDSKGVQNNDIWIMKSDGSEKTQLTTNGSWDDYPIWSGDNMIYFRSNRGGYWNIWRFSPMVNNS